MANLTGKKFGGRTKGTPNKRTSEIKSMITQFIEGNLPDLQANYELLEPDKKLQFFRDLLQYVIPKQRELTSDFETLSDDDLRKLAAEIIDQSTNADDEQE